MATLTAVGAFFISAGPFAALFIALLKGQPHLLVLAICSAFTWCVSMILTGALWLAVVPWKEKYAWVLFLTVTLQEVARLGLYEAFHALQKTNDGVKAFMRPGSKNNVLTGIAVGTGFASLSVLVNFYSQLIDFDADDTAIYTEACPNINFFVAAASLALAYSILHVALGVLVWPAYVERSWFLIAAVYVIHLGIAETGLVSLKQNGCVIALPVVLGLVALVSLGTVFDTRRRIVKSE